MSDLTPHILALFGLTSGSDGVRRTAVYWPDGSLRFLFPAKLRYRDVRLFMHDAPRRALKWYLFLRLKSLFPGGGGTRLIVRDDNLAGHLPNCIGPDITRWSLFGGSPVVNRNAVLWVETPTGQQYFYKCPVTSVADRAEQEQAHYDLLQGLDVPALWVPDYTPHGAGFVLPSVPGRAFRTKDMPLLRALLKQVFDRTQKSASTTALASALKTIHALPQMVWRDPTVDLIQVEGLFSQLRHLADYLKAQGPFPVSLAFGDLVPWNCFVLPHQLAVIDPEYVALDVVAGYDICHFTYQSRAMAATSVQADALRAILGQMGCEVMAITGLDRRMAQALVGAYLLTHISLFLKQYADQDVLHERAYFQLPYWAMTLKVFTQEAGIQG
jgi:hypothetical protein